LLFNITVYSDGEIHLDTPYSRLLGKPPIMVVGMTPSTVKAGFVSAVLDAGYHIKLAGGGHYNTAALSKVAEIQKQIPAGVGITLNSLYINPRQFTFQLPLWQEMRKEGLLIEGFCVAAGIPTTEKAVEITVPFQSIRPTRDFPTFLKNLRKSEKSRKKYFRGQKKMGVTRDGRIDRNGTVSMV
jgi:enoyl reductase-like protein